MVERHTSCTLWLLPAQRGRQAPNRTLPGPSGMCWAGRGKAAQLASQSSQGRLLGRANTSVGSRQLSRSEPGKEGVLAQGRQGERQRVGRHPHSLVLPEHGGCTAGVTGPGLCGLLWPTGSHWRSVILLGRRALPAVLLDCSAASRSPRWWWSPLHR